MSNIDPNATITFHGAEVSLAHEHSEARRLMGLKTTDLDNLQRSVSHIYVSIPSEHEGWANAFLALVEEIGDRQRLLLGLKLAH